MKKLFFVLSFAFTMFFSNAAFASSTDKNLVDTKSEIVLTSTDQNAEISKDIAARAIIILIDTDGDGDIDVIIIIR